MTRLRWRLLGWLIIFVVLPAIFIAVLPGIAPPDAPQEQLDVGMRDIAAWHKELREHVVKYNEIEARKTQLATDDPKINAGLIDALAQMQRGLVEHIKWKIGTAPEAYKKQIPSDIQIFLGGR